MKESSSLLEALHSYEAKNTGKCHVSSQRPPRSSVERVDSVVLSSSTRMSAAASDAPDYDVEIIGEKTVPSVAEERNGAKADEAVLKGKVLPRFTVDKSKKLQPGSSETVHQVPNECGIGSYTIVYAEASALKNVSTNKIAVGTVGERIRADGKERVVFNGSQWTSLGSYSDSAPGNRSAVAASSANEVTVTPPRYSDRSAHSKNSPSSELLASRSWRHADPAIIDAVSLRRPSLCALRPSIGSTSLMSVAGTPSEPDRMRPCNSPTFINKSSPSANASTSSSCRGRGASIEGFYGKSSTPVRALQATGPVCQNGLPFRVGKAASVVSAVRSPSTCAAPTSASLVVATASSPAAVTNKLRYEAVGCTLAGTCSPVPAVTAQPNKAVGGTAKRGRGRPRRLVPSTETVVLSSDEESDEVDAAGSQPKRLQQSDEGSSMSIGDVEDDLFPHIQSPSASSLRHQYSRRLQMQPPHTAKGYPPQGFSLHTIEVRVGTMLCKSVDDLVNFSVERGIRMSLHADRSQCINIRIDGRDLIGCVAHFSKSLAVLFLSCTSALGNKLRQAFHMADKSQPYYDPHGIDEAHKYIVLIFDCAKITDPAIQQCCIVSFFEEISKNCKSGDKLCTVVQLAEANERLAQLRLFIPARPRGSSEEPPVRSPLERTPAKSAQSDKRPASGGRELRQRSLIGIKRRRQARLVSSSPLSSFDRRAITASPNGTAAMVNGADRLQDGSVSDTVSVQQPLRRTASVLAAKSANRQPSASATHPTATVGRGSDAAVPLNGDDDGESDHSVRQTPCGSCDGLPDVEHDSQADDRRQTARRAAVEAAGGSDYEESEGLQPPSVSSCSQSSDESLLALSPTKRRSLRSRDGTQSTATESSRAERLLLYPYPRVMGSIAVTTGDVACLEEEEFLNDVIVDFYLKYLFEERLSPDYRRRTHVFSSFFYMRLMQSGQTRRPGEPQLSVKERRHNGVKTWTRHVDVFDKDYLIVPINENSHWYLAVVCFPSSIPAIFEALSKQSVSSVRSGLDKQAKAEGFSTSTELVDSSERRASCLSKNKDVSYCNESSIRGGQASPEVPVEQIPTRPFILIFDSLGGGSRRCTSVRVLREYLEVEWRTRKGPSELTGPLRNLFTKDSIPGWCPNCPGQDNSCDCGIYLLQYAESFFEEPVMNYTSQTIERLQNWFPQERIRRKRQDIKELLNRMHMSFMQPKQLQTADETAAADGLRVREDSS